MEGVAGDGTHIEEKVANWTEFRIDLSVTNKRNDNIHIDYVQIHADIEWRSQFVALVHKELNVHNRSL